MILAGIADDDGRLKQQGRERRGPEETARRLEARRCGHSPACGSSLAAGRPAWYSACSCPGHAR